MADSVLASGGQSEVQVVIQQFPYSMGQAYVNITIVTHIFFSLLRNLALLSL